MEYGISEKKTGQFKHEFSMNFEIICRNVCDIAKDVGLFIRKESLNFKKSSIKFKSFNSLVSYVDTSAEKMIVRKLQKLIPQSGFITEEKTISRQQRNYCWIIDPLDGTTNFTHGIPIFSISIALMEKNKIILGVVYEINRDECFFAWKDSNSHLNNKEITVSSTKTLSKSLIATGFPYYDFGKVSKYVNAFEYFIQNTQGIRRLGSAAVDLAYVACGRFDGFYEYGLNAWDVAAGSFIIQQAGGKVTDFSGKNNYLFSKEIIAANRFIDNEFGKAVRKSFLS